jgi:hypothetical protein
VDDTVIFAGRVREAKRARKIELELAISGKSARFGESLGMSNADAPSDGGRLAAMKEERDKLSRESEDDWVQMVLFSDWSHGYLQMTTLMREAKAVIEELAEWIDNAFERYPGHKNGEESVAAELSIGGQNSSTTFLQPPIHNRRSPSPIASETETDDSGITFVPKKQHNLSRANSFDACRVITTSDSNAGPAHQDDSSGSDATLPSDRTPTRVHEARESDEPNLRDRRASLDDRNEMYSPEAGTGKPSGQRQKGQTITETEMMRRRRLLDAHIFE